jgi:excisionase family DNA binding protein
MTITNEKAVRPLLSRDEVADVLGVSFNTVRRLIDVAGLPAVRVGNQVRVRPEALDAWLDSPDLEITTRRSADAAA